MKGSPILADVVLPGLVGVADQRESTYSAGPPFWPGPQDQLQVHHLVNVHLEGQTRRIADVLVPGPETANLRIVALIHKRLRSRSA
jgi:hypothetical protein